MILVVYTPFFYDGLAGKLNLTSYGGFPMNNFFALKSGTVIDLSASRSGSVGLGDGKPIPSAEESGLLDLCAEHYSKFKRSEKKTPNVLMVTHPWYSFLSMWATTVEKGREKQALGYFENLLKLLFALRGSNNFSINFFDVNEHYAAVSSSMLENKQVQDVFFTRSEDGHLANFGDRLPDSRAYFIAGSYVGVCMDDSLYDIRAINPNSKLILVPDLTLPHPLHRLEKTEKRIPKKFKKMEQALQEDRIWLKKLEEAAQKVDQVMTLDEVLELAA